MPRDSPPARRLRLLSANIQAGSSTRGYHDYVARSWSHVLPGGNKRGALDRIARLAGEHDIVGLQESDPGSLRSGFTNQTHYLAQQAGFGYWSHQPNRSMGGVASSANGLLSRLEPVDVVDHALPGRIAGRGVLLARFGEGDDGLTVAVAHLSLGAGSRRSQLAFIGELLHGHRHAVLMGDFNCVPDRPEMDVLYQRTHLQPPSQCVPTFPSWRPQRAIDHILVSSPLALHAMRAMQAADSDHLALSIELDVPASALRPA
jgi:endonuclease/exonuclease/phosphatase family metal-dependent hydrolase